MVSHHMAFNDLTLFLTRQFVKYRTPILPHLAKKLLSTKFWNKYYMIFAVPTGMGQAAIIRRSSSFLSTIKPPEEELCPIPVKVKPCLVALVKPVAYPMSY